jgi:hypothetical protein
MLGAHRGAGCVKDGRIAACEAGCMNGPCHRIHDSFPAGEVILSGSFLAAHKQEIIELARHTEEAERKEHPLQRIMSVEDAGGKVTIRTTDIHLPRWIGHAIFDAYKGDLDTRYDKGGYFVRITWERED